MSHCELRTSDPQSSRSLDPARVDEVLARTRFGERPDDARSHSFRLLRAAPPASHRLEERWPSVPLPLALAYFRFGTFKASEKPRSLIAAAHP
jgi:hypothetical protein